MRISNRLKLLSDQVKGFDVICDVGCDHGLFSIYSILNNNVKFAYLLDINNEPLNSAKNNFIKYKLDNAKFILSDGLVSFDEKMDALVISGVGGYLMTKILKDSLNKVKQAKKIILQPNSDFEIVRKFLFENGFKITFEDMILDNKKYCYYLTAVVENSVYTDEDIIFGSILRNNISDVYYNYWNNRYESLLKEINNIKDVTQKEKVNISINQIKENIILKR